MHKFKLPLLSVLLIALMSVAMLAEIDDKEKDIVYLNEQGETVEGVRCATPEIPEDEKQLVRAQVEKWLEANVPTEMMTVIPVAFHILRSSSGQYNVTDQQCEDQIDVLNGAFASTNFQFCLASIDRTDNSTWTTGADEAGFKSALAIDPATTLNFYTGNLSGGVLGWAWLPWSFSEDSFMHGVVCLYSSLPGGSAVPYNLGDTGTHEVGHYLGLYHTFENGCSAPGDEVSDTEYEAAPRFGCPSNPQSCGSPDPYENFMDYTDDDCMNHFTQGQSDRMDTMVGIYKPTLLSGTGCSAGTEPDIDVTPGSFSFTVPENGSDSDIMTISNVGDGTLNWSITSSTARIGLGGPSNESMLSTSPVVHNQNATLSSYSGARETTVIGTPLERGPALADVDMELDDGGWETRIGLTGGGQFLWLNRFTPNPSDYPFDLDEIQVYFGSGSGVDVGELIDIYVYTDADGNPDNGATHVASFTNQAVQALNAWSVYSISPVTLNGPGDVLIGAVNRTAGSGNNEHPAYLDQTNSQVRSYVATYTSGSPGNPPTIPGTDLWGTIDSFTYPGNWMIRGYGSFGGGGGGCDWLSVSPSAGSTGAGTGTNVTVSVDATGYAEGTYNCTLNIASDDPDEPNVSVAVTMVVDNGGGGNILPTAEANGPYAADTGVTINFSSAGSSDPDGSIVTYLWDFDDGNTSNSANPSHSYTTAGTYNVTLTVTDNSGGQDSDGATATITDPPGGIDCADVRDLRARCQGGSTLQAMLRLWTNAYDGQQVTFEINGNDQHTSTINNSRATLSLPGYGAGTHNVEVLEVVSCGVGPATPTCTSLEDEGLWTMEFEGAVPEITELNGNYPNPFNPSTTIRYALSENVHVSLKVYNTLGQEVATLVNGYQDAGYRDIEWNGRDNAGNQVASGIYIYRLKAGDIVDTRQMLFSK